MFILKQHFYKEYSPEAALYSSFSSYNYHPNRILQKAPTDFNTAHTRLSPSLLQNVHASPLPTCHCSLNTFRSTGVFNFFLALLLQRESLCHLKRQSQRKHNGEIEFVLATWNSVLFPDFEFYLTIRTSQTRRRTQKGSDFGMK